MKKVIICVMLLLMAAATFSQQNNPAPTLKKQDYLKKRNDKRALGWIFVAGGATVSMAGVGIAIKNMGGLFDPARPPKNEKLGDVLGYSGLGIMAASIPFFISSSKNKKKARSMSFYINPAKQIKNGNMVNISIPSLSLKVNL